MSDPLSDAAWLAAFLTLHTTLTRLSVGYPGSSDANKAHAALDALVVELEAARQECLEERRESGEVEIAWHKAVAARNKAEAELEAARQALRWIGTCYESAPEQTVASIAAYARSFLVSPQPEDASGEGSDAEVSPPLADETPQTSGAIARLRAERDAATTALRELARVAALDLVGYTACVACKAAHDRDGEWWVSAADSTGHDEDCPLHAVEIARGALARIGAEPDGR